MVGQRGADPDSELEKCLIGPVVTLLPKPPISYDIGAAYTMRKMGDLEHASGRPENAWVFYDDARTLFQSAEDIRGSSFVMHSIGGVLATLDKREFAVEASRIALRGFSRMGIQQGKTASTRRLVNLGIESPEDLLGGEGRTCSHFIAIEEFAIPFEVPRVGQNSRPSGMRLPICTTVRRVKSG